MKKREIDIILPCYNESENIKYLVPEINKVIEQIDGYDFRVVFVNDGSTDDTLQLLEKERRALPRAIIVDLSRNFGKESAIKAGLAFADADAVVFMDADLQHPPKVIIEFIKQWELGYDVVVAKRHDRDTDSPFRRLGTNIFYAALNRISDHRVENGEGDFRLMSRQVVETLNELSESNLFMKGLYGFVGFEKAVVPFDTPVREAGESTFSGFALFKLAVTALVTNSVIPLRFSLWTGLLIVLLSIIYLLSEIVRYTLGSSITAGYTTQIALITLIGGANLIFIGFVGEYVGRVFIETKRRPQFIVKRIYDFDKPNP